MLADLCAKSTPLGREPAETSTPHILVTVDKRLDSGDEFLPEIRPSGSRREIRVTGLGLVGNHRNAGLVLITSGK